MVYNDVRKNANKGFSLVELIVVIAIMAVLTSVLAPSLLAYVERSRAQKDDSAMSEVVNSVLLGLSSQEIYDEALFYSCYNNYSCYIDPTCNTTPRASAAKITTKAKRGSGDTELEQWYYDDNARLDDEQPYYFAGNMRGVTITFAPEKNKAGDMVFMLKNGLINKALIPTAATPVNKDKETVKVGTIKAQAAEGTVTYVLGSPDYSKNGTFSTMSADGVNSYLYNRTRSTCGDSITISSQTYRNSEYTIFIRMGSTGGAMADAQDAVAVYGQWSGTNLPMAATPET
jgi:prepilin-type N-terminal cleavage/methylation domain-containing protein